MFGFYKTLYDEEWKNALLQKFEQLFDELVKTL